MNDPSVPSGSISAGGANASRSKGHIRSHTGLRGVAAILVVAYHQQFGVIYRLPFETATELFHRSYLMVDLFFVLSGFIISYVYAADRPQMMSGGQARDFLVSRFARIYPLHVFSLVYLGLFGIASAWFLSAFGHPTGNLGERDLRDWAIQLLLLNAWLPTRNGWNIPSWSISAEVFAYLIFPALVALNVRWPSACRAFLLMLPLAVYSYVATIGGSLDVTVGTAPLRCAAGFTLGMLLYLGRTRAARLSTATISLLQWAALLWISFALCCAVLDPIIMPAFALLVWSTWEDRGHIAAVLGRSTAQSLGDISYSVYLLHVPLSETIWFFWIRIEPYIRITPPFARVVYLILSFTVILAASTFTYRMVEVPARKALLRRAGAKRPPQGEASVLAP